MISEPGQIGPINLTQPPVERIAAIEWSSVAASPASYCTFESERGLGGRDEGRRHPCRQWAGRSGL